MKPWNRIRIVFLWTCWLSLSGLASGLCYAQPLGDTQYLTNIGVVYHPPAPVAPDNNIVQFSGTPSYGKVGPMIPEAMESTYEKQLSEINQWTGKQGVKVYVILINGLSTIHYNTLPEQANDVSGVLDWSKSSFLSEVQEEGKKIIEQITAQQAAQVNGPSVFCSLIEVEVKYGEGAPQKYQSKKIILFHSTAYNFSGKDKYLKTLDASIASSASTGSLDAGNNMELLMKNIRIAVQTDLAANVDATSLLTLSEKLYATKDKGSMSRCIDTLSKSMMSSFDHPLREHVVRILLSPDELSGSGSGGIPVYNKVQNAGKNAITILDNVNDSNIDSWYTYINTSNGSSQTTIQFIVGAVSRGVFVETGYDAFTKMINRQIVHYKNFDIDKKELLTREDKANHLIVWDNSYVLKIYSTAPIGTNKYKVEFDATGKVKLTKSRVEKWECYAKSDPYGGGGYAQIWETCNAQWEEEAPMLLEPFELIAFINRSDLSLFASEEALTGTVVILPALHLLYAKESEIIDMIDDGISMGFNVATIVNPISELKYGSMLVKNIIYGAKISKKISAYMSLSANLGVGDNNFKDISDAYAFIQSYISIGEKAYKYANTKAVRDMANFVFAVSKRKKDLNTLAPQSEEIRYTLDLANTIDQDAKALKGNDWVEKYRSSSTSTAGQ